MGKEEKGSRLKEWVRKRVIFLAKAGEREGEEGRAEDGKGGGEGTDEIA